MAVFAALSCFNAGELSPKMLGRSDVSQYSKGCRTLKNFLVTPYGSVERRPGLKFVCRTKYPNAAVRLIRFVFSSDIAYICEFGEYYIRFIRLAQQITVNGEPLEISSPYNASELADLNFIQSGDVMTITHPRHEPYELKRVAENSFTIGAKTYLYPPVMAPNLNDALTITPSGVGGTITLTATGDIFTSDNIGGYWQLIHTRRHNEISADIRGNWTSGALEVFGYWTFTTHGTWIGTVTIQRSFDGGTTWTSFRSYSSASDSNVSTSGEEEDEDVLYRIVMTDYWPTDTGTLNLCRVLLSNPDFQVTGVVKITAVANSRQATALVKQKLGDTTPTCEWNEGAWSTRRGFPRTVAFYEERMIFGGTASAPQTVWGSKTNEWNNFKLGSRDDDGLEFTLASDTVNAIRWMCQHDALVIGTMDAEWTLSSSGQDSALTPSNFKLKRQSVYGSSNVPALMVGDVILFVQRRGRKVREFVYTWEKDGYSSPDMTILADHITDSGIVEADLQRQPDTVLWCVLANGTAAALTYERDQQVVGWHRHTTTGKFLSVAVIPDGGEDRVYFAVERNGRRAIEVMAPRRADSADSAFYVDAGIERSGTGMTVCAGLDHLNGMTVQVLGDGAVQRPKTVVNGKITLDTPCSRAVVGLGYESLLEPMPIELETRNGQSILRKKIIGELRIRVYDSVGGEAAAGKDAWQRIISRDVLDDDMDSAITPKSDVIRLAMQGGYEEAAGIRIRQCDPLPLNVNDIVAVYDVTE